VLSFKPSEYSSCSTCGELKPQGQFSPRSRGGYQTSCKSCSSDRGKKWNKDNPERSSANRARWDAANPGRRREISRRWDSNNRDKRNNLDPCRKAAKADTTRRWVQANPEKRRAGSSLRRARALNSAVDRHVTVLWLRERDGDLCHYCHKVLDFVNQGPLFVNLEHKIPLFRGGAHSESNCVLACRTCNLRKGKKTDQEFLAYRALSNG